MAFRAKHRQAALERRIAQRRWIKSDLTPAGCARVLIALGRTYTQEHGQK